MGIHHNWWYSCKFNFSKIGI